MPESSDFKQLARRTTSQETTSKTTSSMRTIQVLARWSMLCSVEAPIRHACARMELDCYTSVINRLRLDVAGEEKSTRRTTRHTLYSLSRCCIQAQSQSRDV